MAATVNGRRLSLRQRSRLDQLEAVIRRGRKQYVAVGNALAEVRDDELYREDYDTFQAYLRGKWDLSESHGYRLIDAAEVADNISPAGEAPDTERQARELVGLSPEGQAEVWEDATEDVGPQPTAEVLRKYRAEYESKPTEQERQKAREGRRRANAWMKERGVPQVVRDVAKFILRAEHAAAELGAAERARIWKLLRPAFERCRRLAPLPWSGPTEFGTRARSKEDRKAERSRHARRHPDHRQRESARKRRARQKR